MDITSLAALKQTAVDCSQNSRAFPGAIKIGAAVLASDNNIYPGCYLPGSTGYTTVHAEHAAIINAYSNGAKHIKAIAVFADSDELESDLVPCGACLQALSDSAETHSIKIFTSDRGRCPDWSDFYLSELLPRPWRR